MKFPLPPASLDSPRGVCKVGRTNMVPEHEVYRVENTSDNLYTISSGRTDPCTFCGILDTARALANYWNPFFLVPLQYHSTVFLYELKLSI